ncbi:MAG: hypothetical protein ACNA7W_21835 [Pseudomonadales bacterium]
MKWLMWGAVALLVGVLGVFGLERFAAESGEVVVLHARDAGGAVVETRLWVVDLDGEQYLRVGGDGSGWFSRLSAAPHVQVERAGILESYLAVPQADVSARVNERMRAKYGWRDAYISALVGGREGSIPIRLERR